MALSLLTFIKRKFAAPPAPVIPPPAPVLDKPNSDRFSKTVLPNATRVAPLHDPFQSSATAAPVATSAPAPTPTISMNAPQPSALPPAVAVALEPRVERVLPLTLSDVLGQMPPGFVRAVADGEASRRILLKAAELERGMANGKPCVSIATIYQQVPEIFLRPVEPSDPAQVALPFAKVLEQFTALQMRSDQHQEQAVPEVETPFLKVTLEDDKRFGTTKQPLRTSEPHPPMRVMPATAQSIAAAEPEATATVMPMPAPTLSPKRHSNANGNGQTSSNGSGHTLPPTAPVEKPATAPTRIPFSLTPNGTGVPAVERVPASSGGASVPTSSTTPSAAPTRIPFKLSPPSDDLKPKGEPWLTKENLSGTEIASAPVAAVSAKAVTKISLPLKPILENLPPFQLTGDVKSVPNDARLELPFSLVEPQLPSGRVSVKPDDFADALPEAFRAFFTAKDIAAPVMLPLQDVLSNLPSAALRMREDQEEQERGSNFATPFSATAAEDAKRFNLASGPVAKPVVSLTTPEIPAAKPEPIRKAEARVEPAPVLAAVATVVATPEPPKVEPVATTPEPIAPRPKKRSKLPARTELEEALATDGSADAKAVVAHVEQISGVEGCAIMFGDGLNLAGELPDSYEAEGLCAMAPSMMQRIENHMVETKLGGMRAMTLSCTNASITFFMQDNLCLAVLHKRNDLASDVRTRLDAIVRELAKTYSQPV